MKKNRAHDAISYPFQASEAVLVDANVWLYLQPPTSQPTPHYGMSYSAVLKNVLTAQARPMIDSLILSEYLNRYWRIEWRAWLKLNPTASSQMSNPKKFRCSTHFASIGKAAASDANTILKLCTTQSTPLDQVDLNEIMTEFENGSLDFNDGVLAETCRLNGWKLLTHDGDMSVGDIEVLTTNPKLLAACK